MPEPIIDLAQDNAALGLLTQLYNLDPAKFLATVEADIRPIAVGTGPRADLYRNTLAQWELSGMLTGSAPVAAPTAPPAPVAAAPAGPAIVIDALPRKRSRKPKAAPAAAPVAPTAPVAAPAPAVPPAPASVPEPAPASVPEPAPVSGPRVVQAAPVAAPAPAAPRREAITLGVEGMAKAAELAAIVNAVSAVLVLDVRAQPPKSGQWSPAKLGGLLGPVYVLNAAGVDPAQACALAYAVNPTAGRVLVLGKENATGDSPARLAFGNAHPELAVFHGYHGVEGLILMEHEDFVAAPIPENAPYYDFADWLARGSAPPAAVAAA